MELGLQENQVVFMLKLPHSYAYFCSLTLYELEYMFVDLITLQPLFLFWFKMCLPSYGYAFYLCLCVRSMYWLYHCKWSYLMYCCYDNDFDAVLIYQGPQCATMDIEKLK